MKLRWYTVVIDCRDIHAQARWWAQVLDDFRLVEDPELDDAVQDLSRRLADGPTLAYAETKSLITRELDMSLAAAVELDASTQALLMTTQDHTEFHAAFNERRPPRWSTIEAPLELARTLSDVAKPDRGVLVECLTLWLSNRLEAGREPEAEIDRLIGALPRLEGPVVFVANEVGLGIVPANALARRYRDVLGRVNASFAAEASRSYLVVAGRGLPLEDVTPP